MLLFANIKYNIKCMQPYVLLTQEQQTDTSQKKNHIAHPTITTIVL